MPLLVGMVWSSLAILGVNAVPIPSRDAIICIGKAATFRPAVEYALSILVQRKRASFQLGYSPTVYSIADTLKLRYYWR